MSDDPGEMIENVKKVLSHNIDVKFTTNFLTCIVDNSTKVNEEVDDGFVGEWLSG